MHFAMIVLVVAGVFCHPTLVSAGGIAHAAYRPRSFTSLEEDSVDYHPSLRAHRNDFATRVLSQQVFSQCTASGGQMGVLPSFGLRDACFGIGDVVGDLFADGNSNITEEIVASTGASNETAKILDLVFKYVPTLINKVVAKATGIDGNICLGDVSGAEIAGGNITNKAFKNSCSYIPMATDNTEWSLIGFDFKFTPAAAAVLLDTICPVQAADGIELSLCVAISVCDGLPSIGVSIGGEAIGCLIGATTGATGVGEVVAEAVDLGLSNLAFGFSLTNAFEVQFFYYDGISVSKLTVNPTIVISVELSITSDRYNIPDFFELFATVTGGLGIIAPTPGGSDPTQKQIEDGLSNFTGGDITTTFPEWTVQGVLDGTLSGILKMTKIPTVGAILKDLNIQIAEISAFFTTGEQRIRGSGSNTTVYPGFYFFAGTNVVAVFISIILNFLVAIVGGILNTFLGWIGVDGFNATSLLDSGLGDVSENDSFGAGIAVSSRRTGFLLNVPLLVAELGQIRINCHIDYVAEQKPTGNEKFSCEVMADANEAIKKFFSAKFEEIKEGLLVVVHEVDETFQKVGDVLVVAVQEVGAAFGEVFSEDNMKKTADDLLKGLTVIGQDILSSVGITQDDITGAAKKVVLLFEPDGLLSQGLGKAVQELSKTGTELIDKAKQLADEAKAAFEDAGKNLEKVFGCSAGSIFGGLCNPYQTMSSGLSANNDELGAALNKLLSDFTSTPGGAILNFLFNLRYDYRLTSRLDTTFQCPIVEIYFVYTVFFVDISEKVAEQPQKECLQQRLLAVQNVTALNATANAYLEEQRKVAQDNLAAVVAASFHVGPEDLNCSTTVLNSEADENGVPVSVTCTAKRILADGTFGDPFTITRQVRIQSVPPGRRRLQADLSINSQITGFVLSVTGDLANEIAKNLPSTDPFCSKTAGPPGDGVDNDCDGSIDNDVLCHYSDRVGGENKYTKDCKCSPPVLGSIASQTVNCSAADKSPDALGRPRLSFEPTITGCPNSGKYTFFDNPKAGQDPADHCGDGVIVRTFKYTDSSYQKSNTVTQEIVWLKEPLKLNTSKLDPVTFVQCTATVDSGYLAPSVVVDPLLGVSQCAKKIDENYTDLSIAYVGCPESPVNETNKKYKGWDVTRLWTVKDECGQVDSYTQTVVRKDEVAPTFVTFPRVRVQSCRASLAANGTGQPVAADQCDPDSVINSRISYVDVGATAGCPKNITRTFTVKDRVCNQISASHMIQTCALELQKNNSTTPYDPVSLLPTFTFHPTGNSQRQISSDLVYYIDSTLKSIATENCLEGSVAYLDRTLTSAVWTTIANTTLTAGVFKVDNGSAKQFSIQLADEKLAAFQKIVNDSGGMAVLRLDVSCGQAGAKGARKLNGCLMFNLKIQ